MLKSLFFDNYENGYNTTQASCIDIPIAGAAGYFNYDNYFYYLFYSCIFDNWKGNFKENNWLLSRNEILGKLGLAVNLNTVNSSSELIRLIKSHIDNSHPIVMAVKYNALFYYPAYMNSDFNNVHGIAISDYDSERSLIIIRESTHVEIVPTHIRGTPLYPLQLTESHIIDIWEKSDNDFEFYSIEKVCQPSITSFNELINDLMNNNYLNKSNLEDTISNYDNTSDKMKHETFITLFKRFYANSIFILFDVLERAFRFLEHNEEWNKIYIEFKQKYTDFRNMLTSKVIAEAMRGRRLSVQQKNEMISNIRYMDNELFSLINNLHKESVRYAAAINNQSVSNSSIVLTPIEDAYVRDGDYSCINYGLVPYFYIASSSVPGYTRHAYLKFDLSVLEMSKCSFAKLKVYCTKSGKDAPLQVYSVFDNSWNETEITWINKPEADVVAISSIKIDTTDAWFSFDVTPLVNKRLGREKLLTICLKDETNGYNYSYINSKDSAQNKLVLEVT